MSTFLNTYAKFFAFSLQLCYASPGVPTAHSDSDYAEAGLQQERANCNKGV